eukprot:SAG22_NODE_3310_length_1788_cov_1.157490_2_plen_130_part_00
MHAGGGNPDENGVSALYFNPYTKELVTGTTKLTVWQTRSTAKANKTERSHGVGVCCAGYNPYMQQVVSCDAASNVLVWDFETGDLSFRFDNAHGDNKVSAMAFDANGSCLLTGTFGSLPRTRTEPGTLL